MNTISAYFSHTIRGKKGKDATKKDMERNCAAAVQAAEWIRENVPEIELYVPAEHEDFVYIAYTDKYLSEDQILDIDCKILGQRDFHIVLEVDEWLGGGIGVEIDAAIKCNMAIFYLTELNEMSAVLLRQMVKDVRDMKETG